MPYNSKSDLFSPVLRDYRPRGRIYSEKALFYTALAGGAFAVTLLSLINSHFLGRIRIDLWRYGLVLLMTATVVPVLVGLLMAEPWPEWMDSLPNTGMPRLLAWAGLAYGVLVAIFLWAPLARAYNHARANNSTRKPWGTAIGCIIAGAAIDFVITGGHIGIFVYWGFR